MQRCISFLLLLSVLLPSAHAEVTLGNPGDRWAQYSQPVSATRTHCPSGEKGYSISFQVADHGLVDICWPFEHINFTMARQKSLECRGAVGSSTFRFPCDITRQSLPRVHEEVIAREMNLGAWEQNRFLGDLSSRPDGAESQNRMILFRQPQKVERATCGSGENGYKVRYRFIGYEDVDICWPRSKIATKKSPVPICSGKFQNGAKLWYPCEITHESLPAVALSIEAIEAQYSNIHAQVSWGPSILAMYFDVEAAPLKFKLPKRRASRWQRAEPDVPGGCRPMPRASLARVRGCGPASTSASGKLQDPEVFRKAFGEDSADEIIGALRQLDPDIKIREAGDAARILNTKKPPKGKADYLGRKARARLREINRDSTLHSSQKITPGSTFDRKTAIKNLKDVVTNPSMPYDKALAARRWYTYEAKRYREIVERLEAKAISLPSWQRVTVMRRTDGVVEGRIHPGANSSTSTKPAFRGFGRGEKVVGRYWLQPAVGKGKNAKYLRPGSEYNLAGAVHLWVPHRSNKAHKKKFLAFINHIGDKFKYRKTGAELEDSDFIYHHAEDPLYIGNNKNGNPVYMGRGIAVAPEVHVADHVGGSEDMSRHMQKAYAALEKEPIYKKRLDEQAKRHEDELDDQAKQLDDQAKQLDDQAKELGSVRKELGSVRKELGEFRALDSLGQGRVRRALRLCDKNKRAAARKCLQGSLPESLHAYAVKFLDIYLTAANKPNYTQAKAYVLENVPSPRIRKVLLQELRGKFGL